MKAETPDTFSMELKREGFLTWLLETSLVVPLPRERLFEYFNDPRHLQDVTPPWFGFTLIRPPQEFRLFEGAEFHYQIQWHGLKMNWHSRIVDYRPPGQFTDIQVSGPYRTWKHLHTFDPVPDGTVLGEKVNYRLPLEALVFETTINRQLEEIFSYRAAAIARWSRSTTGTGA